MAARSDAANGAAVDGGLRGGCDVAGVMEQCHGAPR